ncbi:MAG: DUF58 domain-containing protein [Vicinamibacterales bacterium]
MSGHTPALAGAARSVKPAGPHHAEDGTLVSLSEVTEIELLILKRMREVTIGDHRSLSHGPGFDYVGLRDWQAGDRFSSIDWAQSSLTNFSPLVVREYEQPSTATVLAVADGSLSTRCGAGTGSIAVAVARAVATIGLSAVFFQDLFGLVTFDAGFRNVSAVPPRIGRGHVIHCLEEYQRLRALEPVRLEGGLGATVGSFVRRTAMIPFISDFLFDDAEAVLRELSLLSSVHDVFIVLVDASSAFEMPLLSAGWVETVDVETGRTRTLSRAQLAGMADRVRDWQDEVVRLAKLADLDLVRIGRDQAQADMALAEFVSERRLRKAS